MKRLAGVVAAVLIFGFLPATAGAITIPAGPIHFHLTDYETFVVTSPTGALLTSPTPVKGAELRGLLTIDQGLTGFAGGSPFYTGGVDSLITGTLTGAVVTSVTLTPNGFDLTFAGGTINLYENPPGPVPTPLFANIGLAGAPPPSAWNSGTLIATFTLALGIDGLGVTLQSTATANNPPTSTGNFYADITGGTLLAKLDTNFFSTPFGLRDIQGQTTVIQEDPSGNFLAPYGCTGLGNTGNCFYFTSSDPVKAFAADNPATVLLLGTALLGLAGVARLRKGR